jgi:hypothetical protein
VIEEPGLWAGRVAQVVECCLASVRPWVQSPSIPKKKKNQKKKKKKKRARPSLKAIYSMVSLHVWKACLIARSQMGNWIIRKSCLFSLGCEPWAGWKYKRDSRMGISTILKQGDDPAPSWESQTGERARHFSLLPVCNQPHWSWEDECSIHKKSGVGVLIFKFSLFASFPQEGT